MGSRRKTDAPKSKAHQEKTGPRFLWETEIRPGVDGQAQPAAGEAQYDAWTEAFRAASNRVLEVGSYIKNACGTGFASKFLGVDQAGRAVREYRILTSTVKTGREVITSLQPLDPTGAVLIGRRASGDVLYDIQKATGCTRAFLCGFIDGFDDLHHARKAELIDHPDFIAGRDAGETLRREFVRWVDTGETW